MDRCVCCRKSVMYITVNSVWDWPVICGDCMEKYPEVDKAVEETLEAISKLEAAVAPVRLRATTTKEEA